MIMYDKSTTTHTYGFEVTDMYMIRRRIQTMFLLDLGTKRLSFIVLDTELTIEYAIQCRSAAGF